MCLDNIKEDVKNHLHSEVLISVYGIRNKNYQVRGFISNVYPSIFTVNEQGLEKSFSYSDIATGEVKIQYL
jgi:uncharacterized protein Veg